MMSSNNCVEVLGNCVGWEVRGQLYKHYIINVPNSSFDSYVMGVTHVPLTNIVTFDAVNRTI